MKPNILQTFIMAAGQSAIYLNDPSYLSFGIVLIVSVANVLVQYLKYKEAKLGR